MQQPHVLTGGTPTRASEAAAPVARPGQVPSGERVRARLCFFSAPSGDVESATALWQRLGALGLGSAIALDVAERQRLGWPGIAALVARAGTLALPRGFVAGASSEPLNGASGVLEQITAVVEQVAAIEEAGGVPVLLPLAALSRRRAREDEYVEAYRTLLARIGGPVLIDWTGPSLRPELLDYFPGKSFERVMALEPLKVRGARLALGDVARETRLRRELATREQLLFTADRAHLGHLLLGLNPGPAEPRIPAIARHVELAGQRVALGDFSHAIVSGAEAGAALLGAALERLDAGDAAGLLERLAD
jgi:hypothetical protein